jgi:D-alanyl-D-alanine carboxypeptidase
MCWHRFVAITLVLPWISIASALSAADAPTSFDVAAIDAYIAAHAKEKGLVGLSVGILRDGQIVLAKGYGQRSLEKSLPVDSETSFAVGSVTKQFVCACILLLAAEGKLSVHDTAAKYFPSATQASDITLLDLMNHTSGYPDYYPLDFVDRRMLQPITFEGMLKQYAGGPLDFEPRSRYSYSNTGYILLGGVVEKVTGEKFGDYLQHRILTPLKMNHSRFGGPQGLANGATGYNAFALGSPEPAQPEASGWIEAAGGLWSTPSDLLRWDLALVSGQVLKPESYSLMVASRLLSTGKISNYGCGLLSFVQDGEPILQHTGGVSGFAAFNGMLPRVKSGLVVLSNTEHISATPLRTELWNLLLKDVAEKDAPEVPKIVGPEPKAVVLEFLKQLQAGRIDRANLGDEFSYYLNEDRVQSAAARLKALGEPENVEEGAPAERGGMQVVSVKLAFKTAKLRASLYRSPDGKIQQLLFYGE